MSCFAEPQQYALRFAFGLKSLQPADLQHNTSEFAHARPMMASSPRPHFPKTAAVCDGITANVPNGAWPAGQCNNTQAGSTCTAACNSGFTGSPTSTCNGTWTAVSGSCDVFEVFSLGDYRYGSLSAANTACATYGARVATLQEMQQAYDYGAQWCFWGYATNNGQAVMALIMQEVRAGCWPTAGVATDAVGWNGGWLSANCYGRKPAAGTVTNIRLGAFHDTSGRWSMACAANTRYNPTTKTCGEYR